MLRGRSLSASSCGTCYGVALVRLATLELPQPDFRVLDPNGATTFAYNPNYTDETIGTIDLPALPETAPYIVFLDPSKADTGSLTL